MGCKLKALEQIEGLLKKPAYKKVISSNPELVVKLSNTLAMYREVSGKSTPETTSNKNIRTITINGVTIEYYTIPKNNDLPLATNGKDGIRIQEGITAETVVDYLKRESLDSSTPANKAIEVKQKVNKEFKDKYGEEFTDIIKTLTPQNTRKLILLHEYKHTLQIGDTPRKEFMAMYKKDPVKYELEANEYGLEVLGLLPDVVEKKAESTNTANTSLSNNQSPNHKKSNVVLKPKQQEAYDKMMALVKGETEDNMFLLLGPGGTGKTFTISNMLSDYIKSLDKDQKPPMIIAGSKQHSAKDVLGDEIDSQLGGDIDNVIRVVDLQMKNTIDTAIKYGDKLIVILDEVSMTSAHTMSEIIAAAKTRPDLIKLILIGDAAQIRQVYTGSDALTNTQVFKPKGKRAKLKVGRPYMYTDVDEETHENTKYLDVGDTINLEGSLVKFPIVKKERVRENGYLNTIYDLSAEPLQLKSIVFDTKLFPNLPQVELTESNRQKDPVVYKLLSDFRTTVREPSLRAEDRPIYKQQLTTALDKLKASNSTKVLVHADQRENIEFIERNNIIDSLLEGDTMFIARDNHSVNTINKNLTAAIARTKGQEEIEQAQKFGVFTGQVMRTGNNSNTRTSDKKPVKVHNNVKLRVTKIESVADSKDITPHIVSIYTGTDLYDMSKKLLSSKGDKKAKPQGVAIDWDKLKKDKNYSSYADKIPNVTYQGPAVDAGSGEMIKDATYSFVTFSDYVVDKLGTDGEAIARDIIHTFGYVTTDIGGKLPVSTVLSGESAGNRNRILDELYTQFSTVKPTYASTVHKSQGKTVDNVILATKGLTDTDYLTAVEKLELTYVGLSRSKEGILVINEPLSLLDAVTRGISGDEMISNYSTIEATTPNETVVSGEDYIDGNYAIEEQPDTQIDVSGFVDVNTLDDSDWETVLGSEPIKASRKVPSDILKNNKLIEDCAADLKNCTK